MSNARDLSVLGNAPVFSAYANVATSLPNGTPTKVVFQVEEYDSHNYYNASTGRFTPNIPGYYHITGTVGCNAGVTSGYFSASAYKNGVQHATSLVNAGNGVYINSVSCGVYLNGSTDYIEIFATQASGSTQSSTTGVVYKFQGFLVQAA